MTYRKHAFRSMVYLLIILNQIVLLVIKIHVIQLVSYSIFR